MLTSDRAMFDLARRLRGDVPAAPATFGETFSFLSGLYFRGKIAYARAFAGPSCGGGGAWVITSDRGLVPVEAPVTLDDLRQMATVPVALDEPRYRAPLERDVCRIAEAVGPAGEVVLLGSVATAKYVNVLAAVLGPRLKCPAQFIGLGDMSRGALMLRAAAAGRELAYIAVPLVPASPCKQRHRAGTTRRSD